MSDRRDNTPTSDLFELLQQAKDKNHADMGAEMTKRAPEMETTKPLGAKEQPKRKTQVTKRINAETAELIDKYSTRKIQDPLSDTQKLRLKLAEQNESSELLGYFTEEKKQSKSDRVEKLYQMINDAKTITITDAQKTPPAGIGASRFTDEPEVEDTEPYAQAEMFNFGETLHFEEKIAENEVAVFDSDYEKLTEKISKIKLEFEGDDQTEGQVKFDTDGDRLTIVGGDELDETDINLRLAFEMMEDENGTLDKIAEKNRKKQEMDEEEQPEISYTSQEQSAKVKKIYKNRVRGSLLRIIGVAIMTLVILYLELATPESSFHPDFLKQGTFGTLYVLINLQALFFIGLMMLEPLRNGIKGILKFRLNTDSLLVVALFFATAYSLVILFTNPYSLELKLFNLPAAFASLCAAIARYLNAKKDLGCFSIVSSVQKKYVACELRGGTREADQFSKYLSEDSDIYTVKKTRFVEGFVERTEKRAQFEDVFNFIVPVVFLAGVIVFVVMSILGKTPIEAYSAFSVIIAASVPAASFFMIVLPPVIANKIGSKIGVAFIGNAIAEEYATASVLSFADLEAYPSTNVKIHHFETFSDYSIHGILDETAKIFGCVGGPLGRVLAATFSDKVQKPTSARIIEAANDGLCVAMDGHNYFIGKRSYMRRYRFDAPVGPDDKGFETMYVVVDERLVIKFYLIYKLNNLFNALLKDMYKAGICMGIKTLDPNINNDLVDSQLKFKQCPVAVIRADNPKEISGSEDRVNSGIVCTSSLHNFLKMFTLCEKARHITKSNIIISIISVFLSFATVAFLAITGALGTISSIYTIAFQIFWIIPVCLVSFLMMRR